MSTSLTMAATLALALAGAGCATKKYVTKVITPVEQRVAAAEIRNNEQDKQITANDKEIADLGTDLTRTKEQLRDVDAKAAAAGQSAQQAGQRADAAQRSADGARTLAQQGNDKADQVKRDVDRTISTLDGLNRYQMLKTETVLFAVGQSRLSTESRAQLDDIARAATAQDRFILEVQGYTDKTGSAEFNQQLSQARASEVARYLVNQHKIPVRAVSQIGSGYSAPVGDDSTRDGRAMNRRVEVRLFVPEIGSAVKALSAQTAQR